MGELNKISGAYNGGSPRKNYKNSVKSSTPIPPETESVSMYEGVVKSLYLNNQMGGEDIQHFIYLLGGLRNNTPTTVNLDSKFVLTLLTPINKLYIDGSINDQFLTNLMSKLTAILELTPLPIWEPTIKEKLSSLDGVKNAEKVQQVKPKSKIDTSIKSQELDEIIKIIDKKFIHGELTNGDISSLISYVNYLLDQSTPILVSQSTYFISKTIIHLEKLYLDGKLAQTNLEYLVASLRNTLELTPIEKPVKQIKDKVSAISKNYKK
jgi:hypothetical protein